VSRVFLLIVCAALAALVAGCGGGKKSTAPEIVKFQGPSTVSCAKTQSALVKFSYATKNVTAVDQEIDGQAPGASAGYSPKGGTMRFAFNCPGPHTLTLTASSSSGKTVSKSVRVTSTGGSAAGGPKILIFSGPSVVSCRKKGESHVVSFKYKTQNTSAVEPEIDGQSPGAQAGYPSKAGTMTFDYICPGPHTMTISAFGKGGKTVSKSKHIVPSSGG
jgi:hypothetical protein